MGVFSSLRDVRADIEEHCPKRTLDDFDHAWDRLCEWEADDRDRFARGLLVGAICGGGFVASICTFAFLIA